MIEDIKDNLLSDEQVLELENAMNTKNYKKAYKLSKKYHKQGSPIGAYNLSILYRYGFYVKLDAKKELKYLTIGCEGNHVTSLFAMGLTYLYGRITEQNINQGMRIIQDLADDGHELSINFLHESAGQRASDVLKQEGIKPIDEFDIPMDDVTEATRNVMQKILDNSPSGAIAFPVTDKKVEEMLANKMLKNFFDTRESNAEKSYKLATDLYEMGRVQGYFALGIAYFVGTHVDIDFEKGLLLISESSGKGYVPGMYLGAVLLGSTGKMQRSKDITLEVINKLVKMKYKPAIDALKESPDGIPEGINLSYEYLCEY